MKATNEMTGMDEPTDQSEGVGEDTEGPEITADAALQKLIDTWETGKTYEVTLTLNEDGTATLSPSGESAADETAKEASEKKFPSAVQKALA